MSAQPLRLVDAAGVVYDRDEELDALHEQVEALKHELTVKIGVIARLKADKVKARLEHKRRPEILSIFAEWQIECNHPRSGLTDDTFDCVLALLETRVVRGSADDGSCEGCASTVYDRVHFSRAIAGAKFDPFISTQKNGRKRRHDHLAKICEGGKTFESFCNRAPKGWRPPAEFPVAPPVRDVES